MIWNNSETVSITPQLYHSIFVVDCCQFGPSWIFGLKMELMVCADLVRGTTEKSCLFPDLNFSINDMKYFRNRLYHTSAVTQPFVLLIGANLAQAGFLGWKWSLWPVPNWLAVQRSKYIFFLALYDSINDIKNLRNCLYQTSALPQPFYLLIAANLAQAGFLCWKWSLWSVPTWLVVQRSKAVCFLT